MVTQQLIDYIKQQSDQGVNPEEIKKILHANGWDESDVNQAMKSVGVHRIEHVLTKEPQISVPEKSAAIHRIFPTAKTETRRAPGVILPASESFHLYSASDVSYIQKPSWVFNIFAGLLFISATIVGLNLFFPTGTDLVTLLTTEEEQVDPETARLVAGDPIVANIVVDPNFVIPTVTLGAQESGLGGPKNTYLKFKNEFDQTKNYYEFEALVLKYGSKTRVAQIETGKKEIHSYPPEILQNLFEKIKARTPSASQITTIQEGVSGNFANLIALTTQSGIQGNISMVFEGGLWKLGIESWKGYTATN